VEQAGVVAVVGVAEQLLEPVVSAAAVLQGLQAAVGFDAPVFADAQKDDAVYGLLDSEVEIAAG
jgi:hypothetical protein